MKAVIQRVDQSRVRVDGDTIGAISTGLAVLLGVAAGDTVDIADTMADKMINLRIFEDAGGKMNRSLRDINGEMLVVSQFTLLGDCRKGRRPGFGNAAEPEVAAALYQRFIDRVRQAGIPVQTGRFGARMKVELVNDGPVTFILDIPS